MYVHWNRVWQSTQQPSYTHMDEVSTERKRKTPLSTVFMYYSNWPVVTNASYGTAGKGPGSTTTREWLLGRTRPMSLRPTPLLAQYLAQVSVWTHIGYDRHRIVNNTFHPNAARAGAREYP